MACTPWCDHLEFLQECPHQGLEFSLAWASMPWVQSSACVCQVMRYHPTWFDCMTPRNDQWARAIAGPWASSVPQRTSTCLISRAAECASVTVPYRPIINKKIWFYIIQILYNSFMGLTIWMDDRVPHKYLSHVKLFGINYAIIINWLFTYYTIRLISYKLTALVYISINQSHWASTYQAEIGL